jgi:hypothetical protein
VLQHVGVEGRAHPVGEHEPADLEALEDRRAGQCDLKN